MLRRETVNQWLLAIALHFVLFIVARELKEKNAVLTDSFLKYNDTGEKGPANRIVMFVIGGLRWDVLFSNDSSWQFPAWTVERGTVIPVYTEFPRNDYHGLGRILSGVPGSESINGPTIFRSTETLYIGPPSVRKLFKDIKQDYCYPEVWENMTVNPNETKGDEWVLKTFDQLLSNSSINEMNKTFFFVYLNGITVASNLDGILSHRVHKELKLIFDSLEQLHYTTEKFFHDSKTAYIVTSDYGFVEDGEQTGSTINASIVPFISWGAGLAKTSLITKDLSRLNRKSIVRQQDLTPLMSYLLGTAIPPNNFGDVPVVLLSRIEDKARMSFLNAKQLSMLLLSFEAAYGFGLSSLLSPLNKNYIESYISEIERFLVKEEYYLSILKSEDLIELALDGISFYRNYEAKMLWICVIVSLICWSAVTSGWMIEKVKITPTIQREMVSERQDDIEPSAAKNLSFFRRLLTPSFIVNFTSFLISCAVIVILIFISAPRTISFAAILAIIMSWLAARSSLDWVRIYRSLAFQDLRINKGKPIMHLAYFLIFTCCLSYPIVVQVMFSFAIVFSALSDLRYSTGSHLAYWMLSSLSYLILLHYKFQTPYLPALIIAAILWITAGGIFLHYLKVRYLDWPIFLVVFFSIAIISIHSQYGQHNVMLMFPMITIFFVPIIGSSSLPVRLFQLCLCFSIFVFLLSLCYEPIEFLVILSHLFSWALLEGYPDIGIFLSSPVYFSVKSDAIIWSDIRRSLYFLAYILTSFLVIGNSVNVYDWYKGWPSYFDSSVSINVFLLVLLKSLPVVLMDNIFLAILEKTNSVGYQSVLLQISSIASLMNFLLFPESSVTLYNQLLFFISLLTRPLVYFLLAPSMISLLVGLHSSDRRPGDSSVVRQPRTAETSI